MRGKYQIRALILHDFFKRKVYEKLRRRQKQKMETGSTTEVGSKSKKIDF